jgi:hypothetical protein
MFVIRYRNKNYVLQKRRLAAASERDSSGTTEATRKRREGDGADSPTRGQPKADRSGSPNKLCFAQFKLKIKN